jgi:hypothetical protein
VTHPPYRDGTTHIVLEPLDLIARLAALVSPPRMYLTRFHGVFAPHSRLRAAVTPAHRGMGEVQQPPADPATPPTPRHVAMSWARRLKRVFGIEIEGCVRCGGKLRIIASIEEPEVIAKILSQLARTAPEQYQTELALGGAGTAAAVQSALHSKMKGDCAGRRRGWLQRICVGSQLRGGEGRFRGAGRGSCGRLAVRRGLLVAGLAGQGLSTVGLRSIRPVTRTQIGLDRWFEFPIRTPGGFPALIAAPPADVLS